MQSMDMLLFPVWRSPTINSLWPNPIGTIESIHIRPVERDSDTVRLVIIPAAGTQLSIEVTGYHNMIGLQYCQEGLECHPRHDIQYL